MYICQQFLGLFKSAACCWATQHLFVMISKVRLTHFKSQKRRENSKFYGRRTIFILWTRKIPSLQFILFFYSSKSQKGHNTLQFYSSLLTPRILSWKEGPRPPTVLLITFCQVVNKNNVIRAKLHNCNNC